jgi:hypothetical protein
VCVCVHIIHEYMITLVFLFASVFHMRGNVTFVFLNLAYFTNMISSVLAIDLWMAKCRPSLWLNNIYRDKHCILWFRASLIYVSPVNFSIL